jgi:hypothetical protein
MKKTFIRLKILVFCSILFVTIIISLNLLDEEKKVRLKLQNETLSKPDVSRKNSIVCMIMTSDKTLDTRGMAVWKSWAKYCNITYFGCNCTKKNVVYKDYLTGTKNVTNSNELPILYLEIEEVYMKMAKKAMDLLRVSNKHFGLDNEWYLMADDDTFIFFDNLLNFIKDKEINEPLVYGYNLVNWHVKSGYPQGGAGILFTRESMKRLYKQLNEGKCNYTDGYSDVSVGLCMEIANVSMGYSADSHKRDRFHMYSLKRYMKGPLDDWILKYSQNKPTHGFNCCAEDSISFHYTQPEDMLIYSNLSFEHALKMELL